MASRQYEPGYIEAFRQDFSTDWSSYVAEAQEQLVQAIEAAAVCATPKRNPAQHELNAIGQLSSPATTAWVL